MRENKLMTLITVLELRKVRYIFFQISCDLILIKRKVHGLFSSLVFRFKGVNEV